jgi:hypothetical protein
MKLSCKICLVVLALFASGCASRGAFVYEPGSIVNANNKKLPLKVAVMPLEDKRQSDNTNAVLLYLIPLMPFGPLNYDRPDSANGYITHASYNFRPSEDLAKAAVEELKRNEFFEEVFFTQREKEPGIDMIMTGEIRATNYEGKLITYGLSAYGPLLWFVGFPSSYVTNTVDFSLQLKRVADGVVVWRHDVKREWDKTAGLYYNWGTEFDGYPLMVKEGLMEGMEKLAAEISEKGPNAFTK